jgi:hypothetical protein
VIADDVERMAGPEIEQFAARIRAKIAALDAIRGESASAISTGENS